MKLYTLNLRQPTKIFFVFIALAILFMPISAMATDDDVPFFAGRTGSPNVMVLFDNSDSMQDSPYKRDDGNTYRPSTYWRRGVTINPDCNGDGTADDPCIAENASGSIIYDQSEYITDSNELILPGQNPPNLPGLSTASSTVTQFATSNCPVPNDTLICSNRIYDSNVDWTVFAAWSDFVPYRYWRLRITDLDNSTIQYSNIGSYSSGSGYWRIYGDDIVYDNTHSYSYELVPGIPGEVTYLDSGSPDRVYDRNFDWSTIVDWSYFSSHYRYKILEVYAGTNAGERRSINSHDSSYGYWKVTTPFPVPCDATSRYRILGQENDGKYAQGGNHPDSKMYQAKQALSQFLTSNAITTCDATDSSGNCTDTRYLMNIGFATFMQARKPRTRAKYYRKRGIDHPDQFRYRYRYYRDTSQTVYLPTGCSAGTPPSSVDFDDPWGSGTYSMSVGATVDRSYHQGNCDEQTIRYQLTSITCSPTDSLPDRVKVLLEARTSYASNSALAGIDPDGNPQWGYTRYTWRYFADNGSHDCTTFTPPNIDGKYQLVDSSESCYLSCQYLPAYTENPYYEITWADIWGDLRKTAPATPRYIEQNPSPTATYIVTPYEGYCTYTDSSGNSHTDWYCTSPNPEDISGDGRGDWTLLTTANAQTNVCLHLDSDGNCDRRGDITPSVFDYSEYRYPGINNDPDHPHGWSYKRTERDPAWLTNWRYRMDDGSYLTDDHFIYPYYHYYPATWGDDQQKVPYFPSVSFGEFTNYQGDDQVVFVDLPEYDDLVVDKGDDYAGTNITKVLTYLNLSRQEYPRDTRYVWTMAPISKNALTVSTSTAETGNGTPLAATLADARKYLQSYMEQDPYSQGGCRQNYIILLTDGTETAGGDPVTEAQALQNLVINGEPRPVKVYVVGFGLGLAEKTVLNQIAAAGAPLDDDGNPATAYFANNVNELATILAHDITSDILGGSYGRGSMGITRGGQDTSNGLTLYNGYFDYPIWRGHLEAYDLYTEDIRDTDGTLLNRAGSIKGAAAHWATGCVGVYDPPSSPGDPDGGCIMAESNMDPGAPPDGPLVRRTLYTTKIDGSRIAFPALNGDLSIDLTDLKALVNPIGDDIDGDGNADSNLDAKAVINYIHHPGFDSAKYAGTKDPNWPLGDIYNSGPVIVQGPYLGGCVEYDASKDGTVDRSDPAEWSWANMTGYCQFQESHKNRKGMLYFGTNGGMIEALTTGKPQILNDDGTVKSAQVTGGDELWGYIPGFVLSKLHEMKDGHRFSMDLDILAGEVDTSIGLDGTGWKTMLVAGQRKGGNSYLALDVTDPYDPQPMWEFSDSNLGKTWSRPSFGRILIEGVKTSVVFFGGGYSANANTGNRLYIVKAADGSILKEITVGSNANNVPSTLRTMRYTTNKAGTVVDYRTNLAKLPDGTVIDYSGRRGFIEVVYFGDTSGTVWRLSNLNAESGVTWNPTLEPLYVPELAKARPMYYPPVVFDVKKGNVDTGVMTGCLRRYLMVGTGDEHSPIATKTAGGAPLLDYFFEIEDREWNIGEDDSAHSPIWSQTGVGNDKDTGKFRLNWRFSLGLQLPTDSDGFLLAPIGDGSRVQKAGRDILSSYIYLIEKATFDSDNWSLDANNNLISPAGERIAYAGEYLFKDNPGGLYKDYALTNLVAPAGSYTQVDISLWLTGENGWFYDSEDGTMLVDTILYHYDNEGFWDDGLGNRYIIDGEYISIVTDPGEKMLGVPAGYGGYVYFTTYTPEGGCATGASYFYGLKASSCSLAGGKGILEHYPDKTPIHSAPHRRISLGGGIATGVTLGGGTAYLAIRPGSEPLDIPVTTGDTVLKYWKQE